MNKIQTWDSVVVISGKHKGAVSTVKDIREDRVLLDGVNTFTKAKKGEWHVTVELPVHISTIAHFDADSKTPSKVWIRVNKKGKKERFLKKTWKAL